LVDKAFIKIPSWEIIVELGEVLKVNGQVQRIPYNFMREVGYRQRFITVIGHYKNGIIKNYTFTTSFGLIVQGKTAQTDDGADFWMFIPKVPEMVGNTFGIFGKFDGDRSNDFFDSKGFKRNLTDGISIDNWIFGDSFCVDPNEAAPKKLEMEYVELHDARMKMCRNDILKNARMIKHCDQLATNDVVKCVGIRGRLQLIDQCRIDLCYSSIEEETVSACNAVDETNKRCGLGMPCKK